MFISPSMLERVYVRGSLKNTADGFEFQLKNTVDSGTVSGVRSLTVDGAEVPLASVRMLTSMGEKKAEEIGPRSPLSLPYNTIATVRVDGQTLAPGARALVLSISVYEAGSLQLKINDQIPE